MKHLLFRMLLGMLMFTTAQAVWAQEPSAIGSIRYNKELSAYEIKSTDNLNDLAVYVNGSSIYSTGEWEFKSHTCEGLTFKMTADIAFSHTTDWDDSAKEHNFDGIGGTAAQDFCGTFEGDGHTISGIRINRIYPYQGLFARLNENGRVSGITLTDTRIVGRKWSGGIVGQIRQGHVEDCHVTSTVSINVNRTRNMGYGGIVGVVSNGSVTRCTSSVTLVPYYENDGVTHCEDFGAIVGDNKGTVTDNLVIGATIPAVNNRGAIVGTNEGTLERNYYAACTVADVANATGVGCNNADDLGTADHPDAAVPALRSNADNSTAIGLLADYSTSLTAHHGLDSYELAPAVAPVSVQLVGHTFFKDGKWNTLCLPFDVNDFSGTPLEGAKVMELGNSDDCKTGFDAATGTLHLHFVEVNKTEAGHAYIVRWSSGTDITDPVFTGVTFKNDNPEDQKVVSQDGSISFCGTYAPIAYDTEDRSILLMGTNGTVSTLNYPLSGASLSAFRCYFALDGITMGDGASGIRSFVLKFDDADITGIDDITSPSGKSCHPVRQGGFGYDLSGRKINTKPTGKGIYIKDGKKIVIK